jgi:hypothetical protein
MKRALAFLWGFRAVFIIAAMFWSSPAFCDELHDAAKQRDLNKVTTLLAAGPM